VCPVRGSVKANIGHLEGASGLAGVVKVIMALERGVIPPNALFEKLNQNIDADFFNLQVGTTHRRPNYELPLYLDTNVPNKIPTRNTPWPSPGLRRASVNSFGFGGANSHVILDDAYHYLLSQGLRGYHNCSEDGAKANGTYTSITTNNLTSTPKLLVWSAADRNTIQRMLQAYRDYCASEVSGNSRKLDQLAYTLAARRSMMSWRSFAVADTTEAASGLSEARPVRSSREKLGVAWVFTGQGAQYLGMGLELMDHYPVFKESLLRSDDFLARLGCTWSLFGK
jgi:acyl transferase domain-containing protein